MKKKLVGSISLLVAAALVVVFTVGDRETKAQEESSEDTCTSERCFSIETPERTETEGTRGTCSCGIFIDPDCHYEHVPAFACIPQWHEEDDLSTKEWNSGTSTGSWGLKKYDSGSTQLKLLCPIPADYGLDSNKNYLDVAQVIGYFYHYNSSYSSRMEIFTATPYGSATSLSKGYVTNSSSGQRSFYVYPTGTKYEHWYAEIEIADYLYSSFHGLSICYDPD